MKKYNHIVTSTQMADDRFWAPERESENADKIYSATSPGGMTDANAFYAHAVSTSLPSFSSTGYGSNILKLTKPPILHSAKRLQTHPGSPKLRSPGSRYKVTKFKAPPLKASSTGARGLPHRVLQSSYRMPDNFCYAPNDLTESLNQGSCGSCWAFSMCHMLADRVSIKTNGKIKVPLSPTHVMECVEYPEGISHGGCEGNDPYTAVASVQNKPINIRALSQYKPYTAEPVTDGSCPEVTSDVYSVSCEKAFMISEPIGTPGDEANKRNVENMKQHIYNEGPIIGTFNCPEEFSHYDGLTIYEPGPDVDITNAGGHAIELIGWGKDPKTGVQYWVGRNSWGSAWPSSHKPCAGVSYFYFKMGSNVLNIEAYAAGAIPIIHNPNKAPKNSKTAAFPGSPSTCSSDYHALRSASSLLSPKHVLIPIVVGVGAWFAWKHRDDIKVYIKSI